MWIRSARQVFKGELHPRYNLGLANEIELRQNILHTNYWW